MKGEILHNSETGKYFENPDGEGFIYLESDIVKNGNVGVAIGTNHIPMSSKNPDHGLVIFTYDGNDKIVDIKFVSLELLIKEDSPQLEELVNELDEKGLKDNFKKAIDELEDYCDKRSSSAGFKSTLLGVFSGIIAWKGASLLGLGAISFPLGIITGLAAPIILYLVDNYWDTNEDTIDKIEDAV